MKKPLEILLLLLALPPLPLHAAGIPVTGHVLTPEGKPAAGVRALLVPELPTFESAGLELAGKAGPAPVASVATGEDGGFRLLAPDTGMWTVRLEAPGLAPLEAPLLPLTEETEPLRGPARSRRRSPGEGDGPAGQAGRQRLGAGGEPQRVFARRRRGLADSAPPRRLHGRERRRRGPADAGRGAVGVGGRSRVPPGRAGEGPWERREPPSGGGRDAGDRGPRRQGDAGRRACWPPSGTARGWPAARRNPAVSTWRSRRRAPTCSSPPPTAGGSTTGCGPRSRKRRGRR